MSEDPKAETERPAHTPGPKPITYSLAEVRHGTGWPQGARFALVMGESWLAELLAENEALRSKVALMSDEQGGLIYGMEELQAEVERLKAELLAAEVRMAVGIDLRKEAEAQQDVLAGALSLTVSQNGHYYECLAGQRGKTPDDSETSGCSRHCRTIRAALKAAGRL